MSKIQTIELFIKDEAEDGVFAISLVESPAIESNFVALSEQKEESYSMQLKAVDEERRIVVGFALIPDFEIYRKITDKTSKHFGKEFNIKMSKETISKSQELYMKNLNLANVTAEHESTVTGCCVIESWIVEDPKNDKSNMFKLGAKGGEWVVMMKIDNEKEWQDIKDGKKLGFSIEAMYQGFDQLDMGKDLTDAELLEEIKQLINK